MSNQDVLMDYEAVAQVAVVFNDAAESFRALLGPLGTIAQQLAGQAMSGKPDELPPMGWPVSRKALTCSPSAVRK